MLSDAIEELQSFLDGQVYNRAELEILEAGCGSGSHIRIPADARLTGIDISEDELAKNNVVSKKIVGDVQTYKFPDEQFDMIVCWDVLEHLQTPVAALDHFREAIRPDGIVLLAFPNVFSVKGIVAKITPLGFHRFIYRRIYGERYGEPGLENFPTYLRWGISPKNIERYANSEGLDIVFMRMRESGVQSRFRRKINVDGKLLGVIEGTVRILSFGTLSLKDSDCIFVLRKPALR